MERLSSCQSDNSIIYHKPQGIQKSQIRVTYKGGGRMAEEKYKKFYAELELYERSGVSMRLDNYPASPMQIVTAHMVREDQSYMRDYVWDEKGHVKELAFHNIRNS